MAEAGTLCINADVLKKAGAKASSTATAEAYTNVFIKMAEAKVCLYSLYNWVTNYASVSTIGKELLREATSSLAANMAIQYDMSGFNSRTEAQVMLDLNYNAFVDAVNALRQDDGKKFVLSGALE